MRNRLSRPVENRIEGRQVHVSQVPPRMVLAGMWPAEPRLGSPGEVAEYLHKCINGGCRTLGELKRAVRRARDALREIAAAGG